MPPHSDTWRIFLVSSRYRLEWLGLVCSLFLEMISSSKPIQPSTLPWFESFYFPEMIEILADEHSWLSAQTTQMTSEALCSAEPT